MGYKYLFGPVYSRRLGISLGVDLLPFKTCSLDCLYCECGSTTDLTLKRHEYVPTARVQGELDDCLRRQPSLDYVTLGGCGEPTLHSGIGQIIAFVKERFPEYRVAVLTNGTLFAQADVRRQLRQADLVVPSLDAASEEVFLELNRPHADLEFSEFMEGMIQFFREHPGEVWLEILIVPGINDTVPELKRLRDAVGRLQPSRVQVGTLDRPGSEPWVRPASAKEMKRVQEFLGHVELITG